MSCVIYWDTCARAARWPLVASVTHAASQNARCWWRMRVARTRLTLCRCCLVCVNWTRWNEVEYGISKDVLDNCYPKRILLSEIWHHNILVLILSNVFQLTVMTTIVIIAMKTWIKRRAIYDNIFNDGFLDEFDHKFTCMNKPLICILTLTRTRGWGAGPRAVILTHALTWTRRPDVASLTREHAFVSRCVLTGGQRTVGNRL